MLGALDEEASVLWWQTKEWVASDMLGGPWRADPGREAEEGSELARAPLPPSDRLRAACVQGTLRSGGCAGEGPEPLACM